ncbi:single-stranded DNA-binding protein [Corynebacterium nasicanis]|uniref:Single-stranded DNA-binding protein n=1 Tax=Corynebacterium nasicanis TaxID=1448267 RepID=A0ABW1QC02_9CORY
MATSTTTITGNLTRDPILKKFESTGKELVRLRVAVNRRVLKDEKWVDGDALFITVEAWGSLARHCKASLGSGMPVIATGHLVNSEWQVPGEEKPRYQNILKASSIGLDLNFYIASSRKMDPNERRIEGLQIPELVMDEKFYDETVPVKKDPVDVSHLPPAPHPAESSFAAVGVGGEEPEAPF